jgi:hypothetical protein
MRSPRTFLFGALAIGALVAGLTGCGGDGERASVTPQPAWCDTLGFAQELLEPHNRDLRDLVDASTWDTSYEAAGGSLTMLGSTSGRFEALTNYLVERYEVEAGAAGRAAPEATDEVRDQASIADAELAEGVCG